MVHLTKIYTRTGDDGTTSLANGSRTAKFMPRMHAIGSIDEANAAIGCIENPSSTLDTIQNDLFDMGAEIAGSTTVKITQERIDWLESMIDYYNLQLEPLHSFVLPKGMHHLARAVVRRAERDLWYWYATDADGHAHEDLSNLSLIYLNRLSDLLFVMARYHNALNEALWRPMNG
jgi:cob(I)alamin adenosyltransferase